MDGLWMLLGNLFHVELDFRKNCCCQTPSQGFGDRFSPVLGPILRFQTLGTPHPLLPFPLSVPLGGGSPGMSEQCLLLADWGNSEGTVIPGGHVLVLWDQAGPTTRVS